MGNFYYGQQQPQKKEMTQVSLDVALLKFQVKGYLELNRDRKISQVLNKEKLLIQQIQGNKRNRVDEYTKFTTLVSDGNFIVGCDLVIRCINLLKENSGRLCLSQGNPQKIPDLMPFIETVLWSSNHLNLNAVNEFTDLMIFFFGGTIQDPSLLQAVDPELKAVFQNPIPDARQVNAFVIQFAEKNQLTLDQINEGGHQFVMDLSIFNPPIQYQNEQESINTQTTVQIQIGSGQNPYGKKFIIIIFQAQVQQIQMNQNANSQQSGVSPLQANNIPSPYPNFEKLQSGNLGATQSKDSQ